MADKYPDSPFEHWLTMFAVNYDSIQDENIKENSSNYKQFEGEIEFTALKNEVTLIKNNGDLHLFVPITSDYDGPNTTLEDIEHIAEIILSL